MARDDGNIAKFDFFFKIKGLIFLFCHLFHQLMEESTIMKLHLYVNDWFSKIKNSEGRECCALFCVFKAKLFLTGQKINQENKKITSEYWLCILLMIA